MLQLPLTQLPVDRNSEFAGLVMYITVHPLPLAASRCAVLPLAALHLAALPVPVLPFSVLPALCCVSLLN